MHNKNSEGLIKLRNTRDSSSRINRGKTSETKSTVLGVKRNNPFTVSAINNAINSLYGNSVTPVTKTHTYVKFSPTTQEHLAELEDWQFTYQNPIFDFPLEYEVIESGEHYIDPEVSDPIFTYQYATIPDGVIYPESVPFENIDDLYLDKPDPRILAKSFYLTGNEIEIDSYINGEDGIDPDELENGIGIPPIITCPEGYRPVLWVDGGGVLQWVCISVVVDFGGGIDPPTNECGCTIPTDRSKPAGCVEVERSTIQDRIPVVSVTVKTKDNWFYSDFATTDAAGCWLIDKSYGGNMWHWTVFRNSAVNVKDVRYVLGLVVISDYVGKRQFPFNDNYVFYDESQNVSSNVRAYWAASHTINSIVEYRVTAGNLGVTLPRPGLNVLNFASGGASAAPMLQNVLSPFTDDFLQQYNIIPAFDSRRFLPDIINKYNDFESSQNFNRVLMHELGHASHYRSVGEIYWTKYRTHIINNFGYGNLCCFNHFSYPGIVALGEAYGDFIMNRMTGSIGGGETATFTNGFIPSGLMFDLVDTGTDIVTDPFTGTTVTDMISGFTPAMIDAALGGQLDGIQDIRKFRNNLRTMSLSATPNSAGTYNTFVDQYDVFN